MQTRAPLFTQRSAGRRRAISCVFALALAFVLGSPLPCASADTGTMNAANAADVTSAAAAGVQTSCMAASASLDIDTRNSSADNPAAGRYLSTLAAARSWLDVAANCPSRFGEAVMKSAQARYISDIWGPAFGIETPNANTARENLNETTQLDLPAAESAGIALAEDRAGFEIGVLAARNATGATLALSDAHKAAAARIVSLSATASVQQSGTTQDPRQKVYDVSALLAHPDMIEDPATKLTAPTVAVVEMTCARADIDAMDENPKAASARPRATASSKRQSPLVRHAAVTLTPVSTATTSTEVATAAAPQPAPTATLSALATLIASHAYLAMTLGYPATNAALFK